MSEFNWWLLIVGLVIGAALVWLILADSRRREAEITEAELPAEAAWIAATMADDGRPIDADAAEHVLRLHRAWLATSAPQELDDLDNDWAEPDGEAAAAAEPRTANDASATAARTSPATVAPGGQRAAEVSRDGTTPVWRATDPSPRRR